MNKTIYLACSGLMMIAAGLTLFFSETIGVQTSKVLMLLFILVAGVSSFLFSKYDKLPQVAKQYHKLQGIGIIAYAIFIIVMVDALVTFLMVTVFFVITYGLFELVFAFAVLGSKHKINKDILMSRLAAGGLNLIGGFILLMTTMDNQMDGLLVVSILIIISGVSLIIFARKMKLKFLQ